MKITEGDIAFGRNTMLSPSLWREVGESIESHSREYFNLLERWINEVAKTAGKEDSGVVQREKEQMFQAIRFVFGSVYHAYNGRFPEIPFFGTKVAFDELFFGGPNLSMKGLKRLILGFGEEFSGELDQILSASGIHKECKLVVLFWTVIVLQTWKIRLAIDERQEEIDF